LLRRILSTWPAGQPAVAIIDASDLPAATNEYIKKVRRRLHGPRSRPGRTHHQDGTIPLFYRL